jgi:HlyD family secretion protein
MKKKIAVAMVLLIALAAGGWYFYQKKENGVQFRTVQVIRGDLRATVTATGTVNAVTTVLVGTQVSGTIKEIFVDFNSPVKKGQLLAQIDPELSQTRVAQARANLQSAEAGVEKATAVLRDANRTFERNRTLWERNYIARSELDASETSQQSATAQLSVAKAQVGQARAALQQEETNLQYTRILSPVDGVVISRNVDVGQTVAASFQTPTLFSIAQDLTRMQIETNVDEADIGRIRVGQMVQFTVDAYPDNLFPGSVAEVRNAPTTIQNVVTYTVVVKVANPELMLKPGMTANVSIITASEKNVLKVPNAAIRFKWQPAGGVAATATAPQAGGGRPVEATAGQPTEERKRKSVTAADGAAATGGPPESWGGKRAAGASGDAGVVRPQGERKGRQAAGSGDETASGRSPGERKGGWAAAADGTAGPGKPPGVRGDSTVAGTQGAAGAGRQPAGREGKIANVQGIWVLDGRTPRRVPVTLGISDGNNTAVLAGGLKEGDLVIVEELGKAKGNSKGGTPGPRFL